MSRTRAGAAAGLVTLVALLALPGCGDEADRGDEALITNATSAAPDAIGRGATVIAFDEQGRMRTLREGSGAFTCLPDNPNTPGNDPMCFDRHGLAWAQAWMMKQSPSPAAQVGIAYMLQGSWAASNDDPAATAPAPDQEWVETGPALMILNTRGMLDGYPRKPSDPTQPFVMWPGTPYEHLMVPVASAAR